MVSEHDDWQSDWGGFYMLHCDHHFLAGVDVPLHASV